MIRFVVHDSDRAVCGRINTRVQMSRFKFRYRRMSKKCGISTRWHTTE